MKQNYPLEFEHLWANNGVDTRKEAGYVIYLRMKKKQEEEKNLAIQAVKDATKLSGSFSEVFIAYVNRLREAMILTPYAGEPITEIGLEPPAFDRLVISMHQDNQSYFSFRPSAMHEIRICGIKIVPKRKEV